MPNPEKDDSLYLAHIREAAARAVSYVQGRDRHFFDANPLLQVAVVHRLQVIGEAANKVSAPFRQSTTLAYLQQLQQEAQAEPDLAEEDKKEEA